MAGEHLVLPTYFQSGMVLQQQTPFLLVGLASPGQDLELLIERQPADGRKRHRLDSQFGVIHRDAVTADERGHFSFSIPAYPASYHRYTITVGTVDASYSAQPSAYVRQPGMPRPVPDIKVCDDVLFGEVWVSGGQDNMALPLALADSGQYRDMLDDNDHVRFFLMAQDGLEADGLFSYQPREQAAGGHWTRGRSIIDLRQVSAVAAHFALGLHKQLDIPVGIISTEAAGTLVASWIDRGSIESEPDIIRHLKRIHLHRDEETWQTSGPLARLQPTALYNHRIAPLKGLACRGIIWYQGESDVAFPEYYAEALPLMLRAWERIFQPAAGRRLCFLYCQLAPYFYATLDANALPRFNRMLSEIRERLPLPAGLAVTYDLPLDYADLPQSWRHPLHPQIKQPLGERLAHLALGLAYGQPTGSTCPELDHYEKVGSKLMLTFRPATGLGVRGDTEQLRGFQIAGPDGVFRQADARLLFGVQVMLSHPEIEQPVDCAYAVTELNHEANLSTEDGVGIVPFCTTGELPLPTVERPALALDHLETWVFLEDEKERALPDNARLVDLFETDPGPHVAYREIDLDTKLGEDNQTSLSIRYRALRPTFSLLSFNIDQRCPRPAFDTSGYRMLSVEVFNLDHRSKQLQVEGSNGQAEIKPLHGWQTVRLPLADPADAEARSPGLTLVLTDKEREGSLLLSTIRLWREPDR